MAMAPIPARIDFLMMSNMASPQMLRVISSGGLAASALSNIPICRVFFSNARKFLFGRNIFVAIELKSLKMY
jgi:hypothetical protein